MSAPVDNSETGMANGALAHIGEPPITSLDDKTRAAARHAKKFFAEIRDELLREKNWQFARNSVTPAALPTRPNPRYAFRYVMPADCVNIVRLDRDDFDDWESVTADDDVTVAVMLDTNAVAPTVWYTRRVVNPAQWDDLFRRLFKLALAAKINPLIGRDKNLTATLVGYATTEKEEAAKRDSQGRVGQRVTRTTSWVRARWGFSSTPS